MKVIDLLNKIANGEKVPDNIKIESHTFFWNFIEKTYTSTNGEFAIGDLYTLDVMLNDEVEIIEEKEMCHKCGKYPAEYNQTYCEFCLGISEENKKIEKVHDCFISTDNKEIQFLIDNINQLGNKVNEIIDKINEDK